MGTPAISSTDKIYATMNIHHNNSMEVDDDDNHLNVDLMEDVDVVRAGGDRFVNRNVVRYRVWSSWHGP
jgi:hypothetical protein